MKPGTVLAVVLVALGCAPFANADPVLLVNGSGVLTGARNVRVGGTLYNVTFVDGTCIDVFGGCDTGSDFKFATFEDADAAANALLGQVFVDAPVGNFDGYPELTLGCTDPSQCLQRSLRESQPQEEWCSEPWPTTPRLVNFLPISTSVLISTQALMLRPCGPNSPPLSRYRSPRRLCW